MFHKAVRKSLRTGVTFGFERLGAVLPTMADDDFAMAPKDPFYSVNGQVRHINRQRDSNP